MTRALVFLGLLAVGMVLWTIVSAELARPVKRAERRALRLLMPATGTHAAPVREAENGPPAGGAPDVSGSGAVHPRLGRLAPTPPDGVRVLFPGGEIRVGGTGGFAPVKPTPDAPPWDIPTGSFPAVADAPPVPYGDLPRFSDGPELLGRLRDALRAMEVTP